MNAKYSEVTKKTLTYEELMITPDDIYEATFADSGNTK